VGSTLNARPINGVMGPLPLGIVVRAVLWRSSRRSIEQLRRILGPHRGDGSLVLAGTVTYHDRQDQQIGGWFAVYKGRTAMAPIAGTDYANPAFDVSNPLWPG
jgi:hypothetical protein